MVKASTQRHVQAEHSATATIAQSGSADIRPYHKVESDTYDAVSTRVNALRVCTHGRPTPRVFATLAWCPRVQGLRLEKPEHDACSVCVAACACHLLERLTSWPGFTAFREDITTPPCYLVCDKAGRVVHYLSPCAGHMGGSTPCSDVCAARNACTASNTSSKVDADSPLLQ